MAEIWTMGEMIVEIMRQRPDTPLDKADTFVGPFPSGAPAICIDTVARMGHSAGIISGVGEDDFGKNLLDRLSGDGVDCSLVLKNKSVSTGCAFVTYFQDGSRKFIFHIGNTPAAEAKAPDAEAIKGAKFFHIMGCSLMANADFGGEIIETMRRFAANGTKISFDPNIRPELLGDSRCKAYIDEVMNNTSVFLPGVQELLDISGEKTVEIAVKKCFENPKLEIIALKNGSKGCRIFTREEEIPFGIYPVEVKDPTGAGDCFDGAFLCGLIEGRSLYEAAKRATAAASLNTAAFGPMEGKISVENVEKMIRENPEIQ